MSNDYPLELGLYQALRTLGLDRRLAQMPGVQAEFTDVVESDSAQTLGAYVGRVVTESLARLNSDQRKDAVNRVIASLSEDQDVIDDRAAVVSESAGVVKELTSLRLPESPALPRPKTPLLEPALLTNSRDEPNIGEQIGAELGSADQVDILMAFVKYAGINTIKDQLRQLVERGAQLRVITTTYCGATDRRAVDLLVELGAHVKIRNAVVVEGRKNVFFQGVPQSQFVGDPPIKKLGDVDTVTTLRRRCHAEKLTVRKTTHELLVRGRLRVMELVDDDDVKIKRTFVIRQSLYRRKQMVTNRGGLLVSPELSEGTIVQHLAVDLSCLLQDLLPMRYEQQTRKFSSFCLHPRQQRLVIQRGHNGFPSTGRSDEEIMVPIMDFPFCSQGFEHPALIGPRTNLKPRE